MVVLLVALTFVAFVWIFPLLQERRQRKRFKLMGVARPVPSDYMFTPGHLWLNRLAEGSYHLGLDELILRFMGSPDKIHLIADGELVKTGEPLAIVSRQGKEIYLRAPFTARVVKTNRSLAIQPDKISADPYRQGWLYQLEMLDSKIQLGTLLTSSKAREWIIEEMDRLKEFLLGHQPEPALTGTTMHDGGLLIDGVIDHLDQASVSDFEKLFLMNKPPQPD